MPLEEAGAPEARIRHVGTSLPECGEFAPAGCAMFWGGEGVSGRYLSTGGLYDPVADRWQPAATMDAPPGRAYATAVVPWAELLVWGGPDAIGETGTGGGYAPPPYERWFDIPGDGAPAARYSHTAVWTPLGMVVWGGRGGVGQDIPIATGGGFCP
jgi:hypothetical protein